MAVELGSTQDPRALVPGDPQVIQHTADRLRHYGEVLVDAGQGLKRIDDGGWQGQAAEAFHDFFDGHPKEWLRSGDGFLAAAEAVQAYQPVMEWAQREAGEAIALWNEGQAATEQARRDYEREVAASEQSGGRPPGPFQDPGEAQREQARSMLTSAREQVHTAGQDAQAAVTRAKGQLVEDRSWLGKLWHGSGDFVESAWGELAEFGTTAWKLDPARLWAEPGEVWDDVTELPADMQQAWANASPDDLIDLQQLQQNPGRTLGETVMRFGKLANPITGIYQVVNELRELSKEPPQHHIFISEDRYPESAAHAEDAQNGIMWKGGQSESGEPHPKEVTIEREGARERRQQATSVVPPQPRELRIDRDEYPPAVFQEGGRGASVQYIDRSDNSGSGASMRHQMKGLDNGTTVTINVR
ncbi:hypothetical protein FHX42_001106 [Saccharopolyspora lacisalsi]|uniref:Uncharacterized protein n=1 Tax=Halosaccharopolyspora lacisalsi TaxID=1000566 RepID=A0A839DWE8_9PSEU|nr:NucA/NucB deoxyribonuclease domain-containing protein [Halosaccharopolyspora lacisalsi]MBA8823777.1 hypothetical protein [Halosaccharopolyspora lacisalsi]